MFHEPLPLFIMFLQPLPLFIYHVTLSNARFLNEQCTPNLCQLVGNLHEQLITGHVLGMFLPPKAFRSFEGGGRG